MYCDNLTNLACMKHNLKTELHILFGPKSRKKASLNHSDKSSNMQVNKHVIPPKNNKEAELVCKEV